MKLDPRQQITHDKAHAALLEKRNTLTAAATGGGKTVMFCSLIKTFIEEDIVQRTLVISNTKVIDNQNSKTFERVFPGSPVTYFNANEKNWGVIDKNANHKAVTTFGMLQTLTRHLDTFPHIDLVVLDECHHAAAVSYLKVLDSIKRINPKVMVYGVTATPGRADGTGLFEVFDNVSDVTKIPELVLSGRLVPPKTYIRDFGVTDKLRASQMANGEFDMDTVARIMNKQPLTELVVKEWKELAGNIQTVIFCATVQHAKDVTKVFNDMGERATVVWSGMGEKNFTREKALYDAGERNIIVNAGILKEGWDSPITGCVILLRPFSCFPTFSQIVGRTLRIFPNKTCGILIDGGMSSIIHGTLEQQVDLLGTQKIPTYLENRFCPECNKKIALSSVVCKGCGYRFTKTRDTEKKKQEALINKERFQDFDLVEISILGESKFFWHNLFTKYPGRCLIASGFSAWAGMFTTGHGENKRHHAIGGRLRTKEEIESGKSRAKKVVEYLLCSSRSVCLATANRYLYDHEKEAAVNKSRQWLIQQPTLKQKLLLQRMGENTVSLTRYGASCMINFRANKNKIKELLQIV